MVRGLACAKIKQKYGQDRRSVRVRACGSLQLHFARLPWVAWQSTRMTAPELTGLVGLAFVSKVLVSSAASSRADSQVSRCRSRAYSLCSDALRCSAQGLLSRDTQSHKRRIGDVSDSIEVASTAASTEVSAHPALSASYGSHTAAVPPPPPPPPPPPLSEPSEPDCRSRAVL